MVKQRRIGRRRSKRAEVVDRLDEPSTEEVMPDAVGHHPRGERMLALDEAKRQREPIGRVRHAAIEAREMPGLDDLATTARIAAEVDVLGPWRSVVGGKHPHR